VSARRWNSRPASCGLERLEGGAVAVFGFEGAGGGGASPRAGPEETIRSDHGAAGSSPKCVSRPRLIGRRSGGEGSHGPDHHSGCRLTLRHQGKGCCGTRETGRKEAGCPFILTSASGAAPSRNSAPWRASQILANVHIAGSWRRANFPSLPLALEACRAARRRQPRAVHIASAAAAARPPRARGSRPRRRQPPAKSPARKPLHVRSLIAPKRIISSRRSPQPGAPLAVLGREARPGGRL